MKPFTSLTKNERHFIVTSAMNADLSVKEIAERIGTREHTVRHIRESLVSRGILKPLHKIDIYRLGFTDFRIYLSDIAEPTRARQAFEKKVVQAPPVYWFAKIQGAYQYGLTFLAKAPNEMVSFFGAIQPTDDGFYARKTIAIASDWTVYTPSYLAPEIKKRDSITITAQERVDDLDESDHHILTAMAKNPASNAASLARLTGMKASSLAYRLEKLSANKVWRGPIYLLQTDLLGISVYRVMISERGLSVAERARLQRYISSHLNVVAFLRCAGAWDYEVRFETENPAALEDFCQTIIDSFGPAIGSIMNSQQVSILKRVSYPCK